MRTKILVICSVMLLVGGGIGWWCWYRYHAAKVVLVPTEVRIDRVEKQHRIVLFVHGTFGSTLGLLDVPSVMRDNLKGSIYTKTARSMRKDHFFFCNQPLLQRGLVPFEPSFDVKESIGFFAAYPIGKAVDAIFEKSSLVDEVRHYYSFGWSGLLSQQKRRKEALRLLNELNNEVSKFKARGIMPKITVLSHSHGGNLVLNVGLLVSLLREEKLSTIVGLEHAHSTEEMRVMLARLPERESLAAFQNNKRFDYRPEVPSWNIEHLVLLGMPVQPETDFAVASSLFDAVYHCYSLCDRVQPSDWVSTSRYYSEQRFDRMEKVLKIEGLKLPENLVQARIMFDRLVSDDGKFIVKVDPSAGGKKFSWWDMLVGEVDSRPVYLDPTHKEFWFLVFSKDVDNHLIKPLPVVTFMPSVIELLKTIKGHQDIDVNIAQRGESIGFEAADHLQGTVIAVKSLEAAFVQNLRLLAKKWEADSEFLAQEESLLSQHMRSGR